ncbi:hypothetical protein IAG44_23665 [Streptomyces roseirectus]|uniref:Uncharacterized protein n=1 Tax=Streptomyces roseirectus TaxID=2768066 RepID=A0A7H0IH49_9ACTN|nr:hypothetical protein [Streptomyces roseirectus]QNP72115.1 hypothetical protein IAG44_23665 [Streptomyces roseirectus]
MFAERALEADVLAVGAEFPLALTGGCALRAHGVVGWSRGVGVATEHPARLEWIASQVAVGLGELGWDAQLSERGPLFARLTADGVTISLSKEVFCRPPVRTPAGLALALPDALGVKVRDFVRRGYGRDLSRIAACADSFSWPELEELGRRHSPDGLELPDLQGRLLRTEWLDDTAFTGCPDVARLRAWAHSWSDDIGERLLEGGVPEER